MKILAISDEVVEPLYSGRIREQYADVEMVIACGDLPFDYLEFIVTLLPAPLYYVLGNHDRMVQYRSDGRQPGHYAEGCQALDGRVLRHRLQGPASADGRPRDLLLAGLGGSLRYNLENTPQYTQAEMHLRALGLLPRLAIQRLTLGRAPDILVTHAPPRGIHDAADRAHTGFDAFLWLMRFFRPRLLLHGHTHVYRGGVAPSTRSAATRVLNVYPYRLLEWDPEDV